MPERGTLVLDAWRLGPAGAATVAERTLEPAASMPHLDPRAISEAAGALLLTAADPERLPTMAALGALRQAFETMIEIAWIPGRATIFADLTASGGESPQLAVHLGCRIAGDSAAEEVRDFLTVAMASLTGASRALAFESADPLPLLNRPEAGPYGARIRQKALLAETDDLDLELVSHFAGPGSDWLGICDFLLGRAGTTRLRTTLFATRLGLAHEATAHRHAQALAEPAGRHAGRLQETSIDSRERMDGPLFVVDTRLSSSLPLSEVAVRAIAAQITSELDLERRSWQNGYAHPRAAAARRVQGGFEIEWNTAGRPAAPACEEAALRDLVTLREAALALPFPLPAGRAIPSISASVPSGETAPPEFRSTPEAALGSDAAGSPVELGSFALERHTYVLGASGTGKTTVMLRQVALDLAAGRQVVVIDPAGDYALLVEQLCLESGTTPRVIDPSRSDSAALGLVHGYDCADPGERELRLRRSRSVLVEIFTSYLGIEMAGPRCIQVLDPVLELLIAVRSATVPDVARVLVERDYFELLALHSDAPERAIAMLRQELRASDSAGTLSWVAAKVNDVLRAPGVERMLAPFGEGLDLSAELVSGGAPIIMRLAKGDVGSLAANRLGQLCLTALCEAAFHRPASQRSFVRLFIDEAQSFETPALGRLLDEGRKFGIAVTAANQTLTQLGPRVRESLLANAQTKILFRVSRQDASWLAAELDADPSELMSLPNLTALVRTTAPAGPVPPFQLTLAPPPPPCDAP